MFHKISERIIAHAAKSNVLEKDKEEEYIYGLEISLSVLSSYLSVIIIGIFMGMIWQAVLFLFLFASVRRFAGGFHFKSQIVCYFSTCVICVAVLLIIKYGESNIMRYSVIMALSTLLLLIIAPIPAIEKPLDEKEIIVYRRISRIMLIIIAIVYDALCSFQHIYTARIISVTISVVAVFAILGKIKHILYHNEKAAS